MVNFEKLGKILALALRHKPEEFNLELDKQGWGNIREVVQSIARRNRHFSRLTSFDIEEMINLSPKARFKVQDGKIKALYGHTSVKLELEAETPPSALYVGVNNNESDVILEQGLRASSDRQFVHLSVRREDAEQVAAHHYLQPSLLVVNCEAAVENGVAFFKGNELLWMTETVPGAYLTKEN